MFNQSNQGQKDQAQIDREKEQAYLVKQAKYSAQANKISAFIYKLTRDYETANANEQNEHSGTKK